MNVTQMMNGYAFGTTRREIALSSARKNLARGRATRTAAANKRRDEIPGLVAEGKDYKAIAKHFGVALMTIRGEIRDAAKAGRITAEQEKAALPPIIHQRDRVHPKAHAASIALRVLIVRFVSTTPRSMNELAAQFDLNRSTILKHIEALELDGKVRRVNGYPYKIAALQENGRKNAA